MDVRPFQHLFEYNRWANRRTREAVACVSPEQFQRQAGGSYGSLRNTLAHLIASEWVWLRRWQGTSPTASPFSEEPLTLGNLGSKWQPIELETRAFIDSLTPENLEQSVAYSTTRGQPFSEPLWQQLQHLVNHSSYHRGQIVTLLRQLGAEPVGTDLIAFCRGRDRQAS
jgi:uncharacterized damage-inducible protein DinB